MRRMNANDLSTIKEMFDRVGIKYEMNPPHLKRYGTVLLLQSSPDHVLPGGTYEFGNEVFFVFEGQDLTGLSIPAFG